MIEENRPSTIEFKLYGPHKDKTMTIKKYRFVNGICPIDKLDAVAVERSLRNYSACLENEFETRQADFEESQKKVLENEAQAKALDEAKADLEAEAAKQKKAITDKAAVAVAAVEKDAEAVKEVKNGDGKGKNKS